MYSTAPALPVRFSHQGINESGSQSVLDQADFDLCRRSIDVFLTKAWQNTVHDKVLKLALDYHELSFTQQEIAHAFLIVMVIFEALARKENEESASKAAWRIARLIAGTKAEANVVQKDFFDARADSLCNIRNKVAHGDPTLTQQLIETKYPVLYRYLTKAILTLLHLQPATLDPTRDYYDELTAFVDTRFAALPNT